MKNHRQLFITNADPTGVVESPDALLDHVALAVRGLVETTCGSTIGRLHETDK